MPRSNLSVHVLFQFSLEYDLFVFFSWIIPSKLNERVDSFYNYWNENESDSESESSESEMEE